MVTRQASPLSVHIEKAFWRPWNSAVILKFETWKDWRILGDTSAAYLTPTSFSHLSPKKYDCAWSLIYPAALLGCASKTILESVGFNCFIAVNFIFYLIRGVLFLG